MLSIYTTRRIVLPDAFRRELIRAYDAKVKAHPYLGYWPCTVEIDCHVERDEGSYVVFSIRDSGRSLKVDGWRSRLDYGVPHDTCPECNTCRCEECLRLMPQCRCDAPKAVAGAQQ